MTATPCLRRLPADREDLLIFEVRGRLDAADMRRMADQVGDAFQLAGKIDLLILFRRLEGATAGAVLEPQALKTEVASVTHVRRYGVVGAPAWADALITLGGLLTPIETRTFDWGEDAEARAWIDRAEA